MNHAQLLQSARQGDTKAIVTLLNQCLQVRRVTLVEASLNENCLDLRLVSPKVPNQYKLIPFIQDEISSLGIVFLEKVNISALTDIDSMPAWETSIILEQDWSSAKNLADAVVKAKRTVSEEDEEIVEISENTVEEQVEVPLVTATIGGTLDEPLQNQEPAIFLFPLGLSFIIGLFTGLSLGYFFSLQKTSTPEPTVYSIPQ